jgi:hypothetical protein
MRSLACLGVLLLVSGCSAASETDDSSSAEAIAQAADAQAAVGVVTKLAQADKPTLSRISDVRVIPSRDAAVGSWCAYTLRPTLADDGVDVADLAPIEMAVMSCPVEGSRLSRPIIAYVNVSGGEALALPTGVDAERTRATLATDLAAEVAREAAATETALRPTAFGGVTTSLRPQDRLSLAIAAYEAAPKLLAWVSKLLGKSGGAALEGEIGASQASKLGTAASSENAALTQARETLAAQAEAGGVQRVAARASRVAEAFPKLTAADAALLDKLAPAGSFVGDKGLDAFARGASKRVLVMGPRGNVWTTADEVVLIGTDVDVYVARTVSNGAGQAPVIQLATAEDGVRLARYVADYPDAISHLGTNGAMSNAVMGIFGHDAGTLFEAALRGVSRVMFTGRSLSADFPMYRRALEEGKDVYLRTHDDVERFSRYLRGLQLVNTEELLARLHVYEI